MTAAHTLTSEDLLEHAAWLRRLARALVREDADDVVQETFAAALAHPPATDRPVRPWLASVLRNFVRLRVRGTRRRAEREERVAPRLESDGDVVERAALQREVVAHVLALAEPVRTTVLLRYVDGLSATEISRRQGVAAGTVRWRIKQGLDEVRAQLDEKAGGRSRWVAALAPLAGATTWASTGAVGAGAVVGLADGAAADAVVAGAGRMGVIGLGALAISAVAAVAVFAYRARADMPRGRAAVAGAHEAASPAPSPAALAGFLAGWKRLQSLPPASATPSPDGLAALQADLEERRPGRRRLSEAILRGGGVERAEAAAPFASDEEAGKFQAAVTQAWGKVEPTMRSHYAALSGGHVLPPGTDPEAIVRYLLASTPRDELREIEIRLAHEDVIELGPSPGIALREAAYLCDEVSREVRQALARDLGEERAAALHPRCTLFR